MDHVTDVAITEDEECRALGILTELMEAILKASSLSEALTALCEYARELTGATYAGYFINTTENDEPAWEMGALSGADPRAFVGFAKPRITPLFDTTVMSREVIRSGDVRTDPRYGTRGGPPEGHPQVCSYLAVPVMRVDGQSHGALLLAHHAVDHFTRRHERLMRNVAAKACVALERMEYIAHLKQDITDRIQSQHMEHLLLAELTHRVKNTLTTVQSLANQTLLSATDLESFREGFTGRLHALSATHSVLVQSNWHGATLDEVIRAELTPHNAAKADRWEARGPMIKLTPSAAINLGLVVHELATNAVKYGGLSRLGGRVNIAWDLPFVDGVERLHLRWNEAGGPPASPPKRKGFGSRLLQKIAQQFQGTVTTQYNESGLEAALDIPTTTIRCIDPPSKGARAC